MAVISHVPVLSTPTFHKTHAYGTHACQLVDCLKATIHGLCQQRRKLLVVEYLQITSYINSSTTTVFCSS